MVFLDIYVKIQGSGAVNLKNKTPFFSGAVLRYGVCRFIFGLGVDKVTKFNPKDNMQLLSKPGAQLMGILLPTNYIGPYWTQESGQQPVEKTSGYKNKCFQHTMP